MPPVVCILIERRGVSRLTVSHWTLLHARSPPHTTGTVYIVASLAYLHSDICHYVATPHLKSWLPIGDRPCSGDKGEIHNPHSYRHLTHAMTMGSIEGQLMGNGLLKIQGNGLLKIQPYRAGELALGLELDLQGVVTPIELLRVLIY
jgi:hypothetical protein